MTKQVINWVVNNGDIEPKRHRQYLIKTNLRKAVAYWVADEYGCYHWDTTEFNQYENTAVSEFAEI